MEQRHYPQNFWGIIIYIIPSLLISDATGITGLLLYKQNRSTITSDTKSLLALSVCHFIINISLPFALFNHRTSFFGIFIVLGISCLAILGAGLSYFNLFLLQSNAIQEIKDLALFKAFNSLYLVSLVVSGITFGNACKYLNNEYVFETSESDDDLDEHDQRLDEKSFIEVFPANRNLVSLKASAATLVEPNSNSYNDNNSLIFSSIASNVKRNVPGLKALNQSAPVEKKNYSVKKLSIIKQSNNSADELSTIDDINSENPIHSSRPTSTPVMNKIVDVNPSKTLMIERDAIKRIPSALLPPHLRPQEKTVFSNFANKQITQPTLLQSPFMFNSSSASVTQTVHQSQSFPDFRRESIPEEVMIEQIPKSTTVQEMFPYLSKTKDSSKGLRTISLEDWGTHSEWFKKQQLLKTPSDSFKPFQSESTFGDFIREEESDRFTITECDGDINESVSVFNPEVISSQDNIEEEEGNSTEEVLKYVDNATRNQGVNFYEGSVDQSYSTLHLNELYDQTNISKSNINSPQKSIFRSTSRRNSNSSSVFKSLSGSVPSSPKKGSRSSRSSPKKRIKNLSLTSIVFKDEKDELPNLTYVHELQSSPKRPPSYLLKSDNTKIPQTPKKQTEPSEELKPSPESNHSENSNHLFPSEVIGQYDREKWKTLQRLNMVDTSGI